MNPTGPVHDTNAKRSRSGECPDCKRHNLRKRETGDWYCRTCCKPVPADKVVWRDVKPKGSGVTAPKAYHRSGKW